MFSVEFVRFHIGPRTQIFFPTHTQSLFENKIGVFFIALNDLVIFLIAVELFLLPNSGVGKDLRIYKLKFTSVFN